MREIETNNSALPATYPSTAAAPTREGRGTRPRGSIYLSTEEEEGRGTPGCVEFIGGAGRLVVDGSSTESVARPSLPTWRGRRRKLRDAHTDLVGSRAPWETGREGRPHQFGGPVLICRQKKTPSVTWTTAPADGKRRWRWYSSCSSKCWTIFLMPRIVSLRFLCDRLDKDVVYPLSLHCTSHF